MEKAFRPVPLELLARWVFGELDSRDTVLGIPKANFALPGPAVRLARSSAGASRRRSASPPGRTASSRRTSSPAWLCGARFIELKTVQVLDEIEVSRPCIDAADETYNCEWSQELKLEQSFDEYLKAWVLVHALAHRMGLPEPGHALRHERRLQPRRDPEPARPALHRLDARRERSASGGGRRGGEGLSRPSATSRSRDRISEPHHAVDDARLPAGGDRAIARYLLEELGVHTWVKLNPTLLGPERLRGLLNEHARLRHRGARRGVRARPALRGRACRW